MYGTFTAATLFTFCLGHLHAIPSTVISNDVYPESYFDPISYGLGQLPSNEPPFSLAVARNMSAETDLRNLIMNYVQDDRICYSKSFRQLILGKGESDRKGNVWWAKRCGLRTGNRVPSSGGLFPESTLNRFRRKSSNRASSQQSLAISKADQKKLDKLLKNKKIKCNPKKAVVELPNDDTPFVMLKPSCVYIKRCGGCCDSPHLECVPKTTKTRKFKVLALEKLRRPGSHKFPSEKPLKTVRVEEHKQCHCQCKEREEHCTPTQTYDADACRCQCPPSSIKSCPTGKVWDEKQCDCMCSDISECTTGRYFDTETCRCLRN